MINEMKVINIYKGQNYLLSFLCEEKQINIYKLMINNIELIYILKLLHTVCLCKILHLRDYDDISFHFMGCLFHG